MPLAKRKRPTTRQIVGEWEDPAAGFASWPNDHISLDAWRAMSETEKEGLIVREAQENGIQRPVGYLVSFHYNAEVEKHHFGRSHPMKPWRLTLTKQLIIAYGLHFALDLHCAKPATMEQLATFHSQEYLEFLARITPDNMKDFLMEQSRFNFGDDCPVFDGMWNYSSIYSGASLDAAATLISCNSDIAINWSGGLHHAKKQKASGFCYINDIVLAIQQLLTQVARVLYIDIDVHHGDGVEQAFYSTDRVLTLSFHKFDPANFFPGTGALTETGPLVNENPGAHCTLNVPLRDGIEDDQYTRLFDAIAGPVIDVYDPGAIVIQCGADSLGGDRLGRFNLNIKAHGHCLDFVKSKSHNRKLLVLGGGGYTPRNVARTWCHETSICVGATLRDKIPAHVPYRQAFKGEENGNGLLYPKLDEPNRRHQNMHTQEYLDLLVEHVHEQLRYLKGAPSVMSQHIPQEYLSIRQEIDKKFRDDSLDYDYTEEQTERRRAEQNFGVRGELL